MMAVVTLNRLVFEQAVAQVLERVQSAVRDFEAAADKVQVRAGGVLAQEVRECGAAFRQQFDQALEESQSLRFGHANFESAGDPPSWYAALGAITFALVLFAVGIWVGRTFR